MPFQVVMPQLGLSMDKGRILRWLKQSGEMVRAGDVLLEVESDKATIEVEAVESGILHTLLGSEAGEVPVGTVIANILKQGEAHPTNARTLGATPRVHKLPSSPSARRVAAELSVDWKLAKGTGPSGRIKKQDVMRLAQSFARPTITPVALRIAEEAGLDVDTLAKKFPGRRLQREDVERAIKEMTPVPAQRGPMSGMRKLIAERMAKSSQTTAPVTLTTEANVTKLVRLREEQKADGKIDRIPSYNTLFAKLVAFALREHPDLNTTLDGGEIVRWNTVNIAIAVDTERGLIAPVVREVQAKSLRDLTLEMDEMLERAAQGKATPDELAGSTFTITNLGQYEIDTFTPIINPPECAILGIGRIHKKVIVVDDQPVVCPTVALSLTFDHRLVDGAPAARFLQRVKQLVEYPYLWLTF